MRSKTKFKRTASLLLSAAVFTTFVPNALFAFGAEETQETLADNVTVYSYDGYDVTYTILGEWEGAQNIGINITNTGDEIIRNWAVDCDITGEITNIWNAEIFENKDSEYIIRNNGWNYEIEPEQSIYFGYTINNEESIPVPTKFEMCNKNVTLEDGYEVVVDYTDDWSTGLNGEITINNTSDKPIEAWTLSFNTNFNIEGIWNAKFISGEDGHYTVSSQYHTSVIPVSGSVTFGFNASVPEKGEDYEPSADEFSLDAVTIASISSGNNGGDEDDDDGKIKDIMLSADNYKILAGTGSKTIFFYAMTDAKVSSISLCNSETDEVVAEMVDDGNYSVSGDDMMGDGVYTCKFNVDISDKAKYYFTAKATNENDEAIASNKVDVLVYNPLTNAEFVELMSTNGLISSFKNSEEFKAMTLEEKITAAKDFLTGLATEGTEEYPYPLIKEESITFNAASNTYTYIFTNDVHGALRLVEKKPGQRGTGDDTDYPTIEHKLDGPIEGGVEEGSVKGLCLYALQEDDVSHEEAEGYCDVWRDLGADVTLDLDITIAELKTELKGYDFVHFLTHGDFEYDNSYICTYDEINWDEYETYYADALADESLVLYDDNTLAVGPKFFRDNYGGGQLDGAAIGLGECYGFGADTALDFDLADAFTSCGAECVVGFHDPVDARYTDEFMIQYFSKMLSGKSAGVAYDECVDEVGADEKDFCEKHSYPVYPGPYAYAVLRGTNTSFTFANNKLVNGNFDEVILPHSPNVIAVKGWTIGGDTRVISTLGPIDSQSGNYMAIITTGVGAAENKYISGGKEGSYIYQTFRIPDSAKSLSFLYNYVSEEPMEYVGSKYDDKFTATIFDVNNTALLEVANESINKATWTAVSGIDFAGGDHTTYETGWKKVIVDVSECGGCMITLRFAVVDVGDSAYDSAVLVDNVKFNF